MLEADDRSASCLVPVPLLGVFDVFYVERSFFFLCHDTDVCEFLPTSVILDIIVDPEVITQT